MYIYAHYTHILIVFIKYLSKRVGHLPVFLAKGKNRTLKYLPVTEK